MTDTNEMHADAFDPTPSRPVTGGITYFAVVFAIGVALGTFRIYVLDGMLGERMAVLAELPLMLAACMGAAWWLTGKFSVDTARAALVMGLIGFALLMTCEVAIGTMAFDMSVSEWFAALLVPPGLWGLMGQVGFALFPLVAVNLRG